jgi:hypothetical protein
VWVRGGGGDGSEWRWQRCYISVGPGYGGKLCAAGRLDPQREKLFAPLSGGNSRKLCRVLG